MGRAERELALAEYVLVLGEARAVNGIRRDDFIDVFEVLGVQEYVERAQVLVDALRASGAEERGCTP